MKIILGYLTILTFCVIGYYTGRQTSAQELNQKNYNIHNVAKNYKYACYNVYEPLELKGRYCTLFVK